MLKSKEEKNEANIKTKEGKIESLKKETDKLQNTKSAKFKNYEGSCSSLMSDEVDYITSELYKLV